VKPFNPIWSVPRHADELSIFYDGYRLALRQVTRFLDRNGSIASNLTTKERDHMEAVQRLLAVHVEKGSK